MRNLLIFATGLFMLILFNSCKHDNFKDYVGPSLCPSSSFKFKTHLTVSSTNIDFKSVPGDTIRASFTEPVSWTVTLTGQTSGAKKVYFAHTDTIGIVWLGEPGQFGLPGDYKFFQRGEDVIVSLTIPCVETETKTIKIAHESDFSLLGVMVSDFDGNGYLPNITATGYSNSGWSSYFTNGIGTKTQFAVVASPLQGPSGPNYLTLKGYAAENSWYAGALEFNAPTMPTSDPNDLYFNAFISSGDNTTTVVGITLISAGTNYSKNVLINWKGWRMVSIKLSDFKDKNGNAMPDALKTTIVDMGLNAATKQGQPVELDMDFVIFTKTNPFFH